MPPDDHELVQCEGVDEDGERCSRTRRVPRGVRVSNMCARHLEEAKERERLYSAGADLEAEYEREGLLSDAAPRPTLDVPPRRLMLVGVSVFVAVGLLVFGFAEHRLRYLLLAGGVCCVPVGVMFEAVWEMLGKEAFVNKLEKTLGDWHFWLRHRGHAIAL